VVSVEEVEREMDGEGVPELHLEGLGEPVGEREVLRVKEGECELDGEAGRHRDTEAVRDASGLKVAVEQSVREPEGLEVKEGE
jgi:hypothetical protein